MSDLLAELERLTAISPDDPLGASIELLLRRMKPERARNLRLCAIPHQFNLSVLQALLPEVAPDNLESEFRTLSELSIIKSCEGRESNLRSPAASEPHHLNTRLSGSLFMHDGARRYLFDKWLKFRGTDDARDFVEASRRLAAQFERFASSVEGEQAERFQIERMFHLLGANQNEGFCEFQRLFRIMRRRLRLYDCERLLRLSHEYDNAMAGGLAASLSYYEGMLALDNAQWERARELFSDVALNLDAPLALQIRCHNKLGLVDAERRKWPEAIAHYKSAMSLVCSAEGSAEMRSLARRVRRNLGVAYRDSGDMEQAEELLTESTRVAEQDNDLIELAMSSNSLGTYYRRVGDTERAVELYRTSLSSLQRINDRFGLAQAYNNIGLVYLDQRKWEESRRCFEQSLSIKHEAGDTAGQARTLNNLMQVYINLNDHEQTIRTAKLASRLFEEINDQYNSSVVKRNLARFLRKVKRIDEARKLYEEAFNQFVRIDFDHRLEEGEEEVAGNEESHRSRLKGKSRRRLSPEAAAVNEELRALNRRFWLPWWIWLAILGLLLFAGWFVLPFLRAILPF
jgi:tetratricopeptide (TPR) repeat protein